MGFSTVAAGWLGMHGFIHVVLKDLVVSKFGADKWAAVLTELGRKDEEDEEALCDTSVQYEDSITVAAVVATAKVLRISFDEGLRSFGGHFVEVIYMGGHIRMLRSMGDDICTFLTNVNHLHHSLERHWRQSTFPSFLVESAAVGQGTSAERGEQAFTVSYASSRGGALASLVEGVIPRVAALLHDQALEMRRVATQIGWNATWHVTVSTLLASDQAAPAPVSAAALAHGWLWHFALLDCMRCCSPGRAPTLSADDSEPGRKRATVGSGRLMCAATRSLMTKGVIIGIRTHAAAPMQT